MSHGCCHDRLRGRPRLRPERLPFAEDSQASNCFHSAGGRQLSVARDQRRRYVRSTWNTADPSSSSDALLAARPRAAHQGSAARPAVAVAAGKLLTVEHPEDRGGLLEGAPGGPAVQAPQPLGDAPAAGRMALAKELTSHGLPEMGEAFAGAITPSRPRLPRGPKSFGAKATAVPRGTWATMLAARRTLGPGVHRRTSLAR